MHVYIDGFNFYHGAVKRTQFRWLNLRKVCEKLFPNDSIDLIRYFTARVRAFDHDPQAPVRQDVYIRALRTLPNFKIHDDAWFASHPTLFPQYPLAYRPEWVRPPTRPPQLVQILRLEEKRTDVDIATHLLMDCFLNRFNKAVVISNDGDLALPITMVRDEFHKTIGIVNPQSRIVNPQQKPKISGGLIKASSFQIRSINKKILADSQFSSTLTDATGPFNKPSTW